MEHHQNTSRAEAERLLGIAEKLLNSKDLTGSRDFSILAQETEPLLEGSDQILAVAEVLLAAEIKLSNNQYDWYAILQVPQRSNETDLIKKQYRRLALLLHPDKNKFPFANAAFGLVADAWGVLSDFGRKSAYDNEIAAVALRFENVDLTKKQRDNPHQKLPVRRSGNKKNVNTEAPPVQRTTFNGSTSYNDNAYLGNFWTACPYCHNLYEYPRIYLDCCLRCDNESCKRAFTGAEILSMPPLVPGREAYYCCWGVFPMGFSEEGIKGNAFPNWMPSMFGDSALGGGVRVEPITVEDEDEPNMSIPARVNVVPVSVTPVTTVRSGLAQTGTSSNPMKRGRGRPKKNV